MHLRTYNCSIMKIINEENLSVLIVVGMLIFLELSSFFHLSESTHHKTKWLGGSNIAQDSLQGCYSQSCSSKNGRAFSLSDHSLSSEAL